MAEAESMNLKAAVAEPLVRRAIEELFVGESAVAEGAPQILRLVAEYYEVDALDLQIAAEDHWLGEMVEG